MPRSTREKSKTGTCHVGLGRNQKPVPVISSKLLDLFVIFIVFNFDFFVSFIYSKYR